MKNLERECGVTRVSLANATLLLAERGMPDRVELRIDATLGSCVDVEWYSRSGVSWHTFTGFSWGYGGEGPHGLHKFLTMVGCKISFSRIAEIEFRDKVGTVAEFNWRRGVGWQRAGGGK